MNGERQSGGADHVLITLGGRIRAAREGRGLKIADVAKKLGVGWQTVQNWEIGKKRPSGENLLALSRVLLVTAEELAGLIAGQDPPWSSWAAFLEAYPDLSTAERRSLQAFVWPPGYVPTAESYAAMLTGMRIAKRA